jgi:hypothetical protein
MGSCKVDQKRIGDVGCIRLPAIDSAGFHQIPQGIPVRRLESVGQEGMDAQPIRKNLPDRKL